jgi:eukaryotic-like serine/threonine-protein kinase
MSTSRGDWPTDTATLPPAPPPSAPPPQAEPGNRIGLGMLLAIVLLAAVAAGLAALLLTRNHNKNQPQAAPTTVVVTTTAAPTTTAAAKGPTKKLILPVPDLVGSSWKDASAGVRRAGFKVHLVSASSALQRGTIVAQDPKPGAKVAKGSDIRLKMSTGAAATAATPAAPAAPAATTAQQPTTAQATTTPAPQPATAHVASVTGQQLQSAVQQLDQAGLKASIAYVPSDQPFGTVVAQTPSSGASAPTGSQVTVNVSTGRGQNPMETVPNVVGQRIPQALPALHAVGLRLIVLKTPVKDKSQAGVTALQTPLPGKQAPKNGQVLVYYGAYQG